MAVELPTVMRIMQRANRTLGLVAPSVTARLNQRLFTTPRRFAPREWELGFEAQGTRHRMANGISVLVAGSGPTVALMHGWEGRATQFAHVAAALTARGYRVIGVDGPAHGHSRGRRADPYRFAEALLAVAREYGPLHGAVGHSMGGGSIAIAIAAGLPVARVGLIASPSSLHDVLRRFAAALHMPIRATDAFVRRLQREVRARGHSDADLSTLFADLQVPALVVHARDDGEVPFSDGERMAAGWPGARLLAVDALGHRRILRDPAVIDAVSVFLSER